MVATAAGMVVFFALTTVIVSTMRSGARVSARVEADQNARLASTLIMNQLRSSCVSPRVAPIKSGSTGTSMRFIHQAGSGAVLTPVLSKIELSNGTLTQYDYKALPGTSAPMWGFEEKNPISERWLATGIAPIPPSSSIFFYKAYGKGAVNEVLPSGPLNSANALRTVAVTVAFTASPRNEPVADANAGTPIQDTALLRLTSLAFDKETADPCM
ncbi:MAG TPA: hypothetical protein VFX85_10635 [Solirubrobacterales bacterium]|nr:hypothetical protein [Solirubrobacterales bacterium]